MQTMFLREVSKWLFIFPENLKAQKFDSVKLVILISQKIGSKRCFKTPLGLFQKSIQCFTLLIDSN